jgi:branched-chain amino acid transport system ATP-binding protein
VTFDGAPPAGQPAHARYHAGLAYVPEDRRIVPGLTVRENLQLGIIASPLRAAWTSWSTRSRPPSRA